jgi:hypothetical protein
MHRAAAALLVAGLTACLHPGTRGSHASELVRIDVRNGGGSPLRVRVCSPRRCDERASVAAQALRSFQFPASEAGRFMVEGWAGDWLAVQVAVDVEGPGVRRLVLEPEREPGDSSRGA